MKYYETTFEEYLYQVQQYNYHPELTTKLQTLDIEKDIIFYGSSGYGKYSQLLTLLQHHSPSKLHYYKKISVNMDQTANKTNYNITISDIHFEVDMAILGCNSKKIWHEIFTQIVEIVKLRENHQGIIVCKNFHAIHSELLDIFYSYMQHYRYRPVTLETNKINLSFILMTEHMSFIPNDIVQSCSIVHVKSPSKESLKIGLNFHSSAYHNNNNNNNNNKPTEDKTATQFQKRIQPKKKSKESSSIMNYLRGFPNEDETMGMESNLRKTNNTHVHKTEYKNINNKLDEDIQILNLKEYYCLSLLSSPQNNNNVSQSKLKPKTQQTTSTYNSETQFPKDIFNKVCNQIIEKINNIPETKTAEWFASFRDDLYSILICQLDVSECVFYILEYFIISEKYNHLHKLSSIQKIMSKIYPFLLYYNNNYRPIYHLEMIFLYLISEIYGYSDTDNR